jgi:predicted nucleotidyltransferase
MMNFDACDRRLLDDADAVVVDLIEKVGIDPDSVLLVGAACRDAIHSALGHDFPLRVTSDVDFGIALSNWGVFERIEREFATLGSTGIRFRIGGLPVDIMPFGAIEEPDGIVAPIRRHEDLIVFGFEDVFKRAGAITLPSGPRIRIPQPAGYAALKLRAWVDRSTANNDKDARDLAVACYWYQNCDAISERLWANEGQFVQRFEFDDQLAAVAMLAEDALGQLAPERADDLVARLRNTDKGQFVAAFTLPNQSAWPNTRARLRAYADALLGVE